MSTDQATEGPSDDQSNKFDSSKNLNERCESVQDTGQRTDEQSERVKDERSKKRSGSSLKDSKDDDSCIFSSDICRICHMGNYPSRENPMTWEIQSPTERGIVSQESTLSSFAYLGPLISACKCRGTVAMVHAACLERWLTESGHSRCELCGHKYVTKRIPRHNIFRSIVIWLSTVIVSRQMLLDIMYLVATTPLALFCCYICWLAVRMMLKSDLHDVPWMILAMLPTCSFTLMAYWGWLITLGRFHGYRWRRYWRNNFVIRLMPDTDTNNASTSETLSFHTPEELFQENEAPREGVVVEPTEVS